MLHIIHICCAARGIACLLLEKSNHLHCLLSLQYDKIASKFTFSLTLKDIYFILYSFRWISYFYCIQEHCW